MTEQKITPWTVEAEKDGDKMTTIDYDKVISQFGCEKYTPELASAFQKVTTRPLHRLLRRGLAFAHRDFERIIDCVKTGEKFFLYTGRGPSSDSMHLGHAIPFIFCQYLQEVFQVPLVIQMTDDEKFLFKNFSLPEIKAFTEKNIRDIIAFGFDPKLTFIFTNLESMHRAGFLENSLKVAKSISLNEAMKVFGFDTTANIGMIEFPSREIAAAFSSSFSFLERNMQCLIPCAVDQDPYFRLARDKCRALGERKPATVYLELLPDLTGTNKKMSASDSRSAVLLSDTPEAVKAKINSLAFSGGQETAEEHRRLGGDTEVDVPYQYLRYFLDDDKELERLRTGYKTGEVMSSEMKRVCIETVQEFLREYQERRAAVTDELVKEFKDDTNKK